MSLFQKSELIKQSFFQKIFGLQNKTNFLREVENVLADAEHGNGYRFISPDTFLELALKYRVKNLKNYQSSFEVFFSKILKDMLSDEKISTEELDDLSNLKLLFNFSDSYVKAALEKITNEIYTRKVNDVISDGIITDEEKTELNSVRENLNITTENAEKILKNEIEEHKIEIYKKSVKNVLSGNKLSEQDEKKLEAIERTLLLSEDTANEIYKEEVKSIYQRYFDAAISDKRLSPEEEKQLAELAKNLHLNADYDYATKKLLDKYRLFWIIENQDVPTIACDINIQKSEKLYFKTSITWYELRKETVKTSYSGLSYRSGNLFGIKGLTYRNGTIAPKRITEDVLKPIDEGTLYLTNKRFIFTGKLGNKNINLTKVLSFEIFGDGVQIEKDSGKSPFFAFENDIDLFAVFLGRALKDC